MSLLLWRALFGVIIPVLCQGAGRLRDCIVYRAGQKRIVRGYLDLAREAVMEDLQRMQQLLGESEGKE